jgi:hypothetical protein
LERDRAMCHDRGPIDIVTASKGENQKYLAANRTSLIQDPELDASISRFVRI